MAIGFILFGASLFQSFEAIKILMAISQTGRSPSLQSETDENVPLAPWWAEAQDLTLLAWGKNELLRQLPRAELRPDTPLLLSAIQDAEHAIDGAPGYSPAWLILAELRQKAGAPDEDIAQLLKSTILIAPFDPYRLPARLSLGFSIYSSLRDDARELFFSQIRMAWRHIPRELLRIALMPDRYNRLFIVRLALASDSSALADFEKQIPR